MRIPRILFAAPSSGSGKTLITCGILQALVNRGLKVASFKCGPDYIDPMFHGRVIGTKSRNLDTFFTDGDTLRYLFGKNAAGCDAAVAEGVMGYYDGLGGVRTEGSTYDVARTLHMPVVLIVGCRGASLSVLPLIRGFLEYRADSRIRGVILNQISPMIYEQLRPLIEEELGVKVLGYVPKVPELTLESRHLGLVLPGEIKRLKEKLNALAETLEKTLQIDEILKMAAEAEELFAERPESLPAVCAPDGNDRRNKDTAADRLCVAVAKDEAFCFTYEDNLELLKELGAEIVPFSPLTDRELPGGVCGLILSGGYPELHAKALSENTAMREAVREAVRSGLPCIAECGGFLYLHRELMGADGKYYPMAGVIDAGAFRTERLGRFGYVTLKAKRAQLFGGAGMEIRGHEFHYWDSGQCGDMFRAVKPAGKREWDCVCGNDRLYAGFPHLFFYSNPQAACEFLKKCKEYRGC